MGKRMKRRRGRKEQEDGPQLPPNHFIATIHKSQECAKLGLDTVGRKGPAALKIKKVKDGLISRWNSNNPQKRIQAGDVILAVNDENTDSEALYTMIATSDTLRLLIQRPDPA